ncbi:MAG: cysteine--tRNA ligase [Ignavibacteriaceae bacterium]|nr:cysteine--tRNA ligase [Ignavibacteriaceae bacterium]
MITVYNTLTKRKEEFKPLVPMNVKMYMCGPTVYDYFHIGNGRSFVVSDIIRRYFEYKGFNVKFVMNLTDVDDKIIKKANEEKVETNKITQKYIDAFFEDIAKLKVKKADIYPKATEHIDEIIMMIKTLEEKGLAYNVNGNVFYNVKLFNGYGKLSGKNTEDLESGARIEINEAKKSPLDFALWKKAKEGEPYWESPWGNGRPGWHIECSAMSCKHLGETFDIHAGGNDLIFPHHENEIAQSEGANGKPFVNYWLHFGFLNINDEKMSKSLGNFFTARDILKVYSAEAIRLLFAQTHYGGPLNFSESLLQAAQKGLEKLENLRLKIVGELKEEDTNKEVTFDFDKFYNAFESAMDDDFNSPQAVAVVFDFIREANKAITENEKPGHKFYNGVKEFLTRTAEGVLGIINFSAIEETGASLENELIELLINLRTEAKLNKNYTMADKIRNELTNLGVALQDSKDKTTYKKIALT